MHVAPCPTLADFEDLASNKCDGMDSAMLADNDGKCKAHGLGVGRR
jgi:hypothetical protein